MVVKHSPKHEELIRSSGSQLLPTPNCASHDQLKVPKDGVVDVASLIGTGVVLGKTGNTFPKGSGVIVIWPKSMVPRVMDEPRIGEVHL